MTVWNHLSKAIKTSFKLFFKDISELCFLSVIHLNPNICFVFDNHACVNNIYFYLYLHCSTYNINLIFSLLDYLNFIVMFNFSFRCINLCKRLLYYLLTFRLWLSRFKNVYYIIQFTCNRVLNIQSQYEDNIKSSTILYFFGRHNSWHNTNEA